MKNQICKTCIFALGVLITVLVDAVAGSDVISDADIDQDEAADQLRVDKILHGTHAQPFSRVAKSIAYIENNNNPSTRCGGTLIDKEWVITAAHCVEYPDGTLVHYGQFKVILGALNIAQATQQQTYGVSGVIVHPDHNRLIDPFDDPHDIALIQLNREADLSTGDVVMASLPERFTTETKYDGKSCVTAGWGKTHNEDLPNELSELIIPSMIRNKLCAESYGLKLLDDLRGLEDPVELLNAVYSLNWRQSNICVFNRYVGLPQEGTCPGDSGGPLMCGPGFNTLVGVLKVGDNGLCGGKNMDVVRKPSVYTRVSQQLDFISGTLGRE